MPTHCPNCNTNLSCPCPSCREHEPIGLTDKDRYYWETNGEIVCCPVCGYKNHVDMWLTNDMAKIKGVKP